MPSLFARALLAAPVPPILGRLAREKGRRAAMLLADLVETNDEYTGAHSRSVVSLAVGVADSLRLDPTARWRVEIGALLHDAGKIAVPRRVLNKPGPLTRPELALVRRHTVEGQRLLERMGGSLAEVGSVVRSSHERWDGRGYPDGLAGHEIPVEARIVACCDALSAMTTDRPYRSAMSVEVAAAELRANAGTQFDPAVVRTLLRVMGQDTGPHPQTALAA